jgi:hypothetical protein
MRAWIAVVVGCVSIVPALAQTDFQSGNRLLPACKKIVSGSNADFGMGLCLGMLSGIAGVAHLLPEDARYCPTGTMGQTVRIVVKYMEDHPQVLHQDFQFIALAALRQSWPCRK